LAALLAAITAYTDATKMKIYNKHTYPFIVLGTVLALYKGNYHLILSASIILGVYYLIYAGGHFMAKLFAVTGALPPGKGESPLGGGDLKLAVALALYLGHYPVLYGTLLTSVILFAVAGTRAWATTGSPMAMIYMAAGKLPSKAMPMGLFLGPCTLVVALLYFWRVS
jgi:Flp pilus assembly protein protease CpaA